MPRGGHDHVVARRIVIRHVVAADPGVGNNGGKILARIATAVLGDAAEVSAESATTDCIIIENCSAVSCSLIRAVSDPAGRTVPASA